jgi:16S rRNA processing protein RimM
LTERFQVGVITTPHGLRGEVKVYPTTDDPLRFKILKELILKEKRSERVLRIRSVKFFKQFVILGFEGMDRIEDVEALRGCPLLVERRDAAPLEEDEYYVADLIGLSVRDEDGKLIDSNSLGADADETGWDLTRPILLATGCVLISVGGVIWLVSRMNRSNEDDDE